MYSKIFTKIEKKLYYIVTIKREQLNITKKKAETKNLGL